MCVMHLAFLTFATRATSHQQSQTGNKPPPLKTFVVREDLFDAIQSQNNIILHNIIISLSELRYKDTTV